jgi:hypothetical protein
MSKSYQYMKIKLDIGDQLWYNIVINPVVGKQSLMNTEVSSSPLNRSLLDTGSKKRTQKQLDFLASYTVPSSPTFKDIDASLLVAEYSLASRHQVLQALKNDIVDAARGLLIGKTLEAATKLTDGLELPDGYDLKKAEFERSSGLELLDRVGVSKKQEIEQTITHKAVLLLPSKDEKPSIPIDVEAEDIEYTEVR